MRRFATLLVALLLACSDDTKPPAPPADRGPAEARNAEFKAPWDGFDLQCPMGGPCVLAAVGEGKHKEAFVVIGERVTLTGKNLAGVDACYFGGVLGSVISASATKVVCLVPPRAPAGSAQAIEASTHNGGPTITLPAALTTGSLRASNTGRYLFAAQGGQLLMIDLVAETASLVPAVGSGETVLSFTPVADDSFILATAAPSFKLYRIDVYGSSPAAPVAVSGAPASAAVAELEPFSGGLAGLHPAAATGEGSVWYSADALPSFSWAQSGGSPFLIGSGTVSDFVFADARKGALGLLVNEGGATRLAGLMVVNGKLVGLGTVATPGALMVKLSAGGGYLLVGADAASADFSYAPLSSSGGLALQTVSLGGAGQYRLRPVLLPTRTDLAAVLLGPQTAGTTPPTTLELVDLGGSKRLTTSGGKAAVELDQLTVAVGDPIDDVVHLTAGESLKSYSFTVSGTTVTTTERQPSMVLEKGKVPQSIEVQP